MNLTRITYNGRKAYKDKLSRNTWEPGSTKLVAAEHAVKLLRFAEFSAADGKATESETEAATIASNAQAVEKETDRTQLEHMLLTVESMDKNALEEYAAKYEVQLDKRLAVGKLRAEVANLVEQFGVR